MGGGVTGGTNWARLGSVRGWGLGVRGSGAAGRTPEPRTPSPDSLGGHPDAERRVHRTGLARLGARGEPVPMSHFLGAEWRGEIAVRPVHRAGGERVGAHPAGAGRPSG